MGLLNDTMGSADCDEFSRFMNSVYFDHKRKTRIIDHREFLRLAEAEYRTLYRTGSWTASKNDPFSGFLQEAKDAEVVDEVMAVVAVVVKVEADAVTVDVGRY